MREEIERRRLFCRFGISRESEPAVSLGREDTAIHSRLRRPLDGFRQQWRGYSGGHFVKDGNVARSLAKLLKELGEFTGSCVKLV